MSRKKFYWEKDAEEIKTYTVDFVDYADVGEVISDSTITIDLDGVVVSGMVDTSSYAALVLSIVLTGGTAGNTYDVRVEVECDTGMYYVQLGELVVS